jgi:GNAT superfamily N-acetyltransferase
MFLSSFPPSDDSVAPRVAQVAGCIFFAVPDERPTPTDVASKLWARRRARGTRETLELGRERARELVSSRKRLLFFVREASDGPEVKGDGLIFRQATAADAHVYVRDIGTDSVRTFRERLSDSTRCFLVFQGDLCVHATWMTTLAAWVRELQRYFRPPEGDAYVYESFTRADARGHGVYPFALVSIAAWLDARGIKRIWVGVEDENRGSMKAVTKGGFTAAFEIGYGRRWGRITVDEPVGELASDCWDCISSRPRHR